MRFLLSSCAWWAHLLTFHSFDWLLDRHMNAEKYDLERIYFGGCFIRGARPVFSLPSLFSLWPMLTHSWAARVCPCRSSGDDLDSVVRHSLLVEGHQAGHVPPPRRVPGQYWSLDQERIWRLRSGRRGGGGGRGEGGRSGVRCRKRIELEHRHSGRDLFLVAFFSSCVHRPSNSLYTFFFLSAWRRSSRLRGERPEFENFVALRGFRLCPA